MPRLWMPSIVLLVRLNSIKYIYVNQYKKFGNSWGYPWRDISSESKISFITQKYEVFEMEVCETINTMYNQFNDIIVGLKGLGKVIGMVELNRKLLLSLPKEWCPKVMMEAQDLATMTLEELLESLITHKYTLQMDREKVQINKKKDGSEDPHPRGSWASSWRSNFTH